MIPYGRKTTYRVYNVTSRFEGSVIPYGRKTIDFQRWKKKWFEGSVIPYGRKTKKRWII